MQTAFLPPVIMAMLLPGAPTVTTVALEECVRSNAISVAGECLGGHTAECILVELTNRTDKPISTTIPAGWLMQNSDPDAQDLMIVDLLRNDLGRCAEPGSVTVSELFGLRSYPNVHHLVSQISARWRRWHRPVSGKASSGSPPAAPAGNRPRPGAFLRRPWWCWRWP